ncbi:MAG: ABC transporter ATP-binding protein [Planctomycetota bacterium]|jgi:ABC-2 type transport system ATP-binding protein
MSAAEAPAVATGAPMIQVRDLTKRYGRTAAVKDISFDVAEGEIVGFLGPNGAGKSTVLKTLSTWLPPTSGEVRIHGHDVVAEPLAVRRSLGYLPEHNALYEGMRVRDLLAFLGRARGLGGALLKQRLEWVTESCHLSDVLGLRVEQCSKGYRQRVGLAGALIHDPPVILLDEPTHGLDPLQVVAFREFLHSLRQGRAILFSSHILSEVAAICERVLIIHQGSLIADANCNELLERAENEGADLETVVLKIVEEAGGREQALRGGFRGAAQ